MRRLFKIFSFIFFCLCLTVAQAEENISFKDIFIPQISRIDQNSSLLKIDIPDGYYLYKDKISAQSYDGKNIKLEFSESSTKVDEIFGEVQIFSAENKPEIKVFSQDDEFLLNAQGCQDGKICFPPEQWKISLSLGGALPDENNGSNLLKNLVKQDDLNQTDPTNNQLIDKTEQTQTNAQLIKQENNLNDKLKNNYWSSLPFILLLGIGLSFTACMYPLIPIISSLVIGKNNYGIKAYLLIFTYVISMAIALSLLGAIFGLFNNFNLQAALQKNIVLIPCAVLFVFLSLALFDFFNIQAPVKLQNFSNKIASKQKSGEFIGAAVLGFISILVISPCSTPVLTALLLFSTQTSSLKAALALFIFGLGTGLPLFLFAGFLRRFMPKTGAWSLIIKRIYAWLMLAIAIYIFSRVLSNDTLKHAIWALYFLAVAVFCEAQSSPQIHHSSSINYLMRYLAGIAFIAAILSAIKIMPEYNQQASFDTKPKFEIISSHEYNKVIQNKQATLIDFYADWCISCQHLERELSKIPELNKLKLYKIDLSNYGEAERNLLKKLNIAGPPALIFKHQDKQDILIGKIEYNQLHRTIKNFIN